MTDQETTEPTEPEETTEPTEPEETTEPTEPEETTVDTASSILASMKEALNIPQEVSSFDTELTMSINAIFAKLNQLGVGPETPFSIDDDSAEWAEFDTEPMTAMVKPYMYLELRLVFDPPTASVLTAMKEQRDEWLWRLNVACDDRRPWADEPEDEDGQNGQD